jgi:hypothetical protein
MKYAVEMGSGVMIRIPSFVEIGLGIRTLIRGGYTDTGHKSKVIIVTGSGCL